MSENDNSYRDEQFWFTAAVVSFNTIILGQEISDIPKRFLLFASCLVSLLGMHIVLTRWIAAAKLQPADPPDWKTASASQRLKYTLREMKVAWKKLPYIIAEASGSLFYLLLMLLTFIGVLWKLAAHAIHALLHC
jgi:hypothetical protein